MYAQSKSALFNNAHAHGLIARNVGDAIAFCPPLIITETEIADMNARFARELDDTAAWVDSDGLKP